MKTFNHFLALLATFVVLVPVAFAAETIINTVTVEDQASSDRAVVSQEIQINTGETGLTVRKEVAQSSILIGGTASFTVTITNNNSVSSASNIVMDDFFDEQFFSLETGSIEPSAECYGDASRIRCTFASLAPGSSKTITYRLSGKKAGSSVNAVQVNDSTGNTAEDSALVVIGNALAEFELLKDASRSTMIPGEEIEFYITVRNPTTDMTFTDIIIEDDYPEQFFEFLDLSATGFNCQQTNGKIECTINTLAPGGEYTFISRFRASQIGTAVNTVTATTASGQTITESEEVVIIDDAALFQITKTPNKEALQIGDDIEYTIVIQNLGQQDVQNVTVIDVYPEQILQFQNVVPGNGVTCTETNGSITCDIADFTVGGLYTFTTRYTAIAAGGAGNTVTVSDQLGRSATESVDVIVTNPDTPFYVSKEPDKPNVNVGDDVIFTVNIGLVEDLGNIRRISLVDDFDESFLQIKDIQFTGGIDCVRDASQIRCTIENPTPGQTFTIVSRFTALQPGTANNSIIMEGDDGTVVGATDSFVVVLDPGNPFLITKSPNKKIIDIGEEVDFTVSVTNRTPNEPLSNVTIVDDFPQELLEFISLNTSLGFNCQADSGEVRCQIEDFAPDETYTFTARYKTLAAGTASNTVKAEEENGMTNEATANVTILDPGDPFLVTKHPSKNKIEVGEQIDYMIRIKNRTPAQTFDNVIIVDDYPESVLELQSIVASDGMTCTRDQAEIRCQIEEFKPQEGYLLSAKYEAIEVGQALNTVTVTEQNGQTAQVISNVEIVEPEITELLLTSNCENRTVLVNQKCTLTVVAKYRYIDEKIVSQEATFLNFENIGTLGGNLLVTTEAGLANIIAIFENVTSNPIIIEVVEDLAIATDPDGNFITHLPVRVGGGLPDTAFYHDVIAIGEMKAGPDAVAKSSRLVLSAFGGADSFNWTLVDNSFGNLSDFNTGQACSRQNSITTCDQTSSVIFDAGQNVGTATLRLADSEGRSRTITLHILPPATESILILDENGAPLSSVVEYPRDRTITFSANERLADNTNITNVEAQLIWEFSYNGGDWTSSSSEGTIAGGVLQAYRNGTYVIRAKREQNLGMPGVANLTQAPEDVISDEITVQIGDPIPYIDSIRLEGNLGIAEGATETIFVRLRHFNTFIDLADIEINLLRGHHTSVEDIPDDVQHFEIELVPEEILLSNAGLNTALFEIPFLVPILDDLRDGPHTIRIIANNSNGLDGINIVTGLLNVYVGTPQPGDANLDGKVDLVDAVMTARFLSGTVAPDSLQIFATDIDRSGVITLRDFLDFFRNFLLSFLAR